jgi:hypothetical protein
MEEVAIGNRAVIIELSYKAVVFNWQGLCAAGDTWQYPEKFLVVIFVGGGRMEGV